MAFRRGEYLWLSDFAHGSRTLRLVIAARDFDSNELEPLGELEPLAEPPDPNRVTDLFRAK